MKNWTLIILTLICSCTNTDHKDLSNQTDTELPITSQLTLVDSLHWTKINEHFEYAFTEIITPTEGRRLLEIESIGSIDNKEKFAYHDSIKKDTTNEVNPFNIQEVDQLISENFDRVIYLKISSDYYVNQRKDILEFVMVNPKSGINKNELLHLSTTLDNLTFVENVDIIKQDNSLFLNENDSSVIIQLKVTEENRNIDSLISKTSLLKTYKQIDNAFYNDLLEKIRGQHFILKITTRQQGL
jgi:hypothetical protein